MDHIRLCGPARAGDMLGGRYQLEELIGEGGMGSVWRATDCRLERMVAVKIFWVRAGEGSDADRRESEKRLLAAVSHPSLVTIHDAHLSDEDLSFLVMEYVDGGTLASLIARGPIAPRDAASLATDLGEALHVVHQAGIIHRDVKPANILLRPPLSPAHTFRAVLADFGIAHVMDASRVTTPGVAMGTAAYISPEQVRGHAPTPASDVYSLGLVLLEALSGARPFPAQTPIEAISVRLAAAPTVPGRWGYGWKSLLTAMTALDPAARPSAVEVAARARLLDTAPADAASTLPIDLVAAAQPLPASASTDAPATEPPPTTALPAPVPSSRPVARTRSGVHRQQRRHRRYRRSTRLAGAAALTVTAGAIGLTAWLGAAAAVPAPTPLPQLNQIMHQPTENDPLPAPEPAAVDGPVLSEDPPAAANPSVPDSAVVVVTDPVPGGGNGKGGPGSDNAGSGNDNAGPGNNNGNGNRSKD